MEIGFKKSLAALVGLLIAVLYLSPQIPEMSGGVLGGSQLIGLLLLAGAALVFLFGTGNVK